jgi:TPR repeat protein
MKKQRLQSRIENVVASAQEKWDRGELRAAFRSLLTAAKLGEITSQLNLGYFYDTGPGVKPNRTAAMHWYKLAYRKGAAPAANNIGTIYRDEGKFSQAISWFTRAAELGDAGANLEIARVQIERLGAPEKAIPYLRKVVKAKSGIDVAEHSWESARDLLDRIEK